MTILETASQDTTQRRWHVVLLSYFDPSPLSRFCRVSNCQRHNAYGDLEL